MSSHLLHNLKLFTRKIIIFINLLFLSLVILFFLLVEKATIEANGCTIGVDGTIQKEPESSHWLMKTRHMSRPQTLGKLELF